MHLPSLIEHYIERQNITAFKTRLVTEADPVTRATLIRLLAQEEAKSVARMKAANMICINVVRVE